MKFQQLVLTGLTGLFALTTVTAQAAFAQALNQTHLTSSNVAAIAKSRTKEVRTPAPSATQTLNLTHSASDQVSTVQNPRMPQAVQKADDSFLNPTQSSSDDTAAIGINAPFNR